MTKKIGTPGNAYINLISHGGVAISKCETVWPTNTWDAAKIRSRSKLLTLNSFSTDITNSIASLRLAAIPESPYESMREFIDTRNVSSGEGVVRSDQPVISVHRTISPLSRDKLF